MSSGAPEVPLAPHEPYRAWSNFEFIADDGSINEVDLLVLRRGSSWSRSRAAPGFEGDAGTWTWEHEGKLFTDDNPLFAANRKAKKLKSLLERQKALESQGPAAVPRALIFCSAPDQQNELEGNGRLPRLPAGPGRRPATARPAWHHGGLGTSRLPRPGDPRGGKTHIDRPTAKAISQAMDQAGIRPSRRSRKVSDFVLDQLVTKARASRTGRPPTSSWRMSNAGSGFTSSAPGPRPRIGRPSNGRPCASSNCWKRLQHPGILRTHGFTEHELGPALIFEHFPKSIRLDHYMAQCGDRLAPEARLDLCGRSPKSSASPTTSRSSTGLCRRRASCVTNADNDRPQIKVFNWQVGYRERQVQRGVPRGGQITGTIDRLVENASTAYMAPRPCRTTAPGEHLDIFSLGAIAYHIFSGKPRPPTPWN